MNFSSPTRNRPRARETIESRCSCSEQSYGGGGEGRGRWGINKRVKNSASLQEINVSHNPASSLIYSA